MNKFSKKQLLVTLGAVLLLGLPTYASTVNVYVGYADELRGVNFPSPWLGSPNTIFRGGGSMDAGAIMLTNTGAVDVTYTDFLVSVPGWTTGGNAGLGNMNFVALLAGNIVVPAGKNVILTQTYSYNFDTSDYGSGVCGVNNGVLPTVTLKPQGGTSTTLIDSGQILNTGGFDLACRGNEALGWRLIGTTGIGDPGNQVPEPATLALLGISLAGFAGIRRRGNKNI